MTADEYVVDQLLWAKRDLQVANSEKNKLEVENLELKNKINRIIELVQKNVSISGETLNVRFRNWDFDDDYVRDFNEFIELIGLEIREEKADESSSSDGQIN